MVAGLSVSTVGVTVLYLLARHFIRRLVLIQPMKTSPDMTEKWLTGT